MKKKIGKGISILVAIIIVSNQIFSLPVFANLAETIVVSDEVKVEETETSEEIISEELISHEEIEETEETNSESIDNIENNNDFVDEEQESTVVNGENNDINSVEGDVSLQEEILDKENSLIQPLEANDTSSDIESNDIHVSSVDISLLTYEINDDGTITITGCTSLTEIKIPTSVESISSSAFAYCTNLKYVYYDGSKTQFKSISIEDYNSSLTNAKIYYNSSGIINNSDFEIPQDIFSFDNSSYYYGDTYYISRSDFDGFMNSLSSTDQWSIRSVVGRFWDYGTLSTYNAFNSKDYEGICFGINVAEALINNKYTALSQFDRYADYTMEVEAPIDNDDLKSMLTYYWMLQFISEFDNEDKGKGNIEMAQELVNALLYENSPVIVNFNMSIGGAHSVLAYGIDEISNENYFIIYISDPNTLVREQSGMEQPIMMINKDTYEVLSYHSVEGGLQLYSSFISVISDLSKFENYLSPTGIVIVPSKEYTVITTYEDPQI